MQPPASLKALADPIYEAFYGLREEPFSITTDPRFFYLSASHEHAYTELLNGLRRREGLMVVSGETGTGKTTLCRAVLQGLGPRTFAAVILNPYMSGPEVFRIVLRDFGLVSHEDLRRGALSSADVPQLFDTLEGFLRSLMPLDAHAVIVLDEAQSVAPVVLDQLRMLTALEQDNKRLVQIVLCGQPGLLKTLTTEPMLALNERITRRVALDPLPASEVLAYIQHRLTVAGGAEAVSFDTGAADLIADLSHGLPRRVNVLCDRALQEGRIEGVNVINADLVKRAARSVAGVHHDAAAPAPSEPRPDASMVGSLTFGQEATTTDGSKFRKVLFAVAGGVVAAGILGWALTAYRTASFAPAFGSPTVPTRDVGVPVTPLAVPATPEPVRRVPEPVTPVPPPVDVAPEAVPPAALPEALPSSGQTPGNSNQFN